MRESAIGPITMSEAGPDLVVETDKTQIAVIPGEAATVSLKIGRFNGFSGRVRIDLLNHP